MLTSMLHPVRFRAIELTLAFPDNSDSRRNGPAYAARRHVTTM